MKTILHTFLLCFVLGTAGCSRAPEITPAPERVVTREVNGQGAQTLKYTITAQIGFDVTVSWVFPDASTLTGQHYDLTALAQQILAANPALTLPQEAALLDSTMFVQGIAVWQGQLAAAAKTSAQTKIVTDLASIVGVQRTVTQ